jgi:hypothetical protein
MLLPLPSNLKFLILDKKPPDLFRGFFISRGLRQKAWGSWLGNKPKGYLKEVCLLENSLGLSEG